MHVNVVGAHSCSTYKFQRKLSINTSGYIFAQLMTCIVSGNIFGTAIKGGEKSLKKKKNVTGSWEPDRSYVFGILLKSALELCIVFMLVTSIQSKPSDRQKDPIFFF